MKWLSFKINYSLGRKNILNGSEKVSVNVIMLTNKNGNP